MISDALDELAGAMLYFKCENLQLSGSFKIRGAANAVFSLSEAEARPERRPVLGALRFGSRYL